MLQNKAKEYALPFFICVITILLLFLQPTLFPYDIYDEADEEQVFEWENPYYVKENVGDIALQSIPGVIIRTYRADNYAQARYLRDDKQILDMYEFEEDDFLFSGKDYTQAFIRALIQVAGYPEGIELDGDATFTSHDATYVLDGEDYTYVGLFILNAKQWILLKIPEFPIDEEVAKQLRKDINDFSSYTVNRDFNDYPSMKHVKIKEQ